MPSFRLEAVTVCVEYSDFLAETVKHNAHHFDRWVIVTSPQDTATIDLCRRWNLQCVMTGEMRRAPGERFNKGRGVSLGLNYLSTDAWALHLDADVVLPAAARQMMELAQLQEGCLYGADRIGLHSWEEWQELQSSGYLHAQHGWHLCCNFPAGKSVGTRIVRGRHGYVPIGFFQLWHNQDGVHSGVRFKDYPDANSDAAHSDIKFALQWDRRHRVLLPELVVVHLESERAAMGANWGGRKTRRFGPKASAAGQNPTTKY
jgi:hypothetical protein